jgi:hypothetical protein
MFEVEYAFQKTKGFAEVQISDYGVIWCHPESNRSIFAVADGYSGSIGQTISARLTQFVATMIENEMEKIVLDNVVVWLSNLFDLVETFLGDEIVKYLRDELGLETKCVVGANSSDVSIFWRNPTSSLFLDRSVWQIMDGGCSFTMVVIIDDNIFTASVGHCGATIHSNSECFEEHDIGMLFDASMKDIYTFRGERSNKRTNTLVLNSDQSPTSWYEYCRVKSQQHDKKTESTDFLQFLYDSDGKSSSSYTEIYNAFTTKTNGHYYKNVEKEYGAVVKKSTDARRALSSTRGFLNHDLKPFGVTHKPTITSLRLDSERMMHEKSFTLFIGSNGVFDNWFRTSERAIEVGETNTDRVMGNFFNQAEFETKSPSSILEQFMNQTLKFNEINFKKTYDDACGILVKLSRRQDIEEVSKQQQLSNKPFSF